MKRIDVLICTAVIMASLTGRASSAHQSNTLGTSVLDRSVSGSAEHQLSTTEAFSQTLISAGAAGGLIKVEGCEPDLAAPHRWPEKDVTLSAFLDTITGENPWYRWELTDGALDLVPSSGDPALLRTRITHIHLRSVVLNNAIHQIISLPEVQQAAVNLGLTPGFVTLQGLAPLAGRKTFNLSCKNVTVREALNAAALAEGRGIWAYTEYHCGGKNEYTVDVRAE